MTQFCIFLVFLGSVGVLWGWTFGVPILTQGIPGTVTTKVSTAFSFLVCAALYTTKRMAKRKMPHVVTWLFGLACFVFLAELTRQGVSVFGSSVTEEFKSVAPGVPSRGTTAGFIGVIVALCPWVTDQITQIAFRAVGAIGSLALLGYWTHIPIFYYYVEGSSTAMSPITAALFVIIALPYSIKRLKNESLS